MRKAVVITLMLSLIVAVHESGHLLAARAFNVPVEEFAIGFGPKVISHQWGATTISLRVLPFGGFNKIEQAELEKAKPFKQLIILVVGPLLNALLAAPFIWRRKYGLGFEGYFEKIDERYRWQVMAVVIPLFFWLVGPLWVAWLLITGKIGYEDMLPHKFYTDYDKQLHSEQKASPNTQVTSVWASYFASITLGMAAINMFPLLPIIDGSKVFSLLLTSIGVPHARLVALVCGLLFTVIVTVLWHLRERKRS